MNYILRVRGGVLFCHLLLLEKIFCQHNIVIVPLVFIEMPNMLFTFHSMEVFLVVKGNDMQ